MTREQQEKVLEILGKGNIDRNGKVNPDQVIYTYDIQRILEQNALIFYNSNAHCMYISCWDESLMHEPEKPKWKQKIREILGSDREIDEEGDIQLHTEPLYTYEIGKIIKAGGNLWINRAGKVNISNWIYW